MGSQQLLLLVVGFIVVVFSIYVGVRLFENYAQTTNRDYLINTISLIANSAQQYVKKPASTGGGGGDFTGWDIPQNLQNFETGTFRARVRNDRVNLVATGVESGYDSNNKVAVTAIVYPTKTDIVIQN